MVSPFQPVPSGRSVLDSNSYLGLHHSSQSAPNVWSIPDSSFLTGLQLFSGFQSLRMCVSVLEIVFVGQCEVFVCLDFVNIFFPLGREAHRSANGVSVL